MTPIAKRGLVVTSGFVVLMAALAAAFVTLDSAGMRGVAIGLALGLVNLVVSLLVTRRSLQTGGMRSAMATITGGFTIRVVLLVTLFLIFQGSTISGAAFALTFVASFFVYLAAEILMIEQLRAPRHA